MDREQKYQLAFLISGSGRTLENFFKKIDNGELPGASVCTVISSCAGAYGIERAKNRGIDTYVIPRKEYADSAAFSVAVTAILKQYTPDLVLMAGLIHLYIVPPEYDGKVLNIHPALLPKFGGKGFYTDRVHKAVLASGETESGCTVHYASNEYDRGRIILQKKVSVLPGDTAETLAARVFEAECEAYPVAVKLVTQW